MAVGAGVAVVVGFGVAAALGEAMCHVNVAAASASAKASRIEVETRAITAPFVGSASVQRLSAKRVNASATFEAGVPVDRLTCRVLW